MPDVNEPATGGTPDLAGSLEDDLVNWMDNDVLERISAGANPARAIDASITRARAALVRAEEEMTWRQRDFAYRPGRGRTR